jgi:hypothetical protein
MTKFRFAHLSVLLITFSLLAAGQPSSKAFAAGFCQNQSAKPGFSVGSATRGSVVTLCGKFVAQKALPIKKVAKPKSPPDAKRQPKPKNPPRPTLIDPKTAAKLLHRRLAMAGETSFTPSQLLIRANPTATKPNTKVVVSIDHATQFRTAYLIGRFVGLRFIPVKIDLHFDAATKVAKLWPTKFAAKVSFKTKGTHAIRGIVTYRTEYRISGSKEWMRVAGNPQLAAIATKVFVAAKHSSSPVDMLFNSRPLLVANDCPETGGAVGCLN